MNGAEQRLEYETLFALGPLCGIDNPDVVLEAARICDLYGLDTISAGGTIAWAMECSERGLLPQAQRLRFGQADDLLAIIPEIAGVARLLAKTQTVPLTLAQGATLADVYTVLAEQLPVLFGRVITSKGLVSGYSCNINGLDFVRAPDTKINTGDKLLILSADAGG